MTWLIRSHQSPRSKRSNELLDSYRSIGYFANIRGLREGPQPELELQQFRGWFRPMFHSPKASWAVLTGAAEKEACWIAAGGTFEQLEDSGEVPSEWIWFAISCNGFSSGQLSWSW